MRTKRKKKRRKKTFVSLLLCAGHRLNRGSVARVDRRFAFLCTEDLLVTITGDGDGYSYSSMAADAVIS